MTKTFVVRVIAPDVVAELRHRDDAGRTPEPFVDRDGDSPLRCCNHLSKPGEWIVLASYSPLQRWVQLTGIDPGAYVETGPVFLHAERCAGPAHDGFPDDYRGLPRVLRAYDGHGRIVGGQVIAAGDTDPEATIEQLFADRNIAFVHARALVAGCFTFAIERASA